MGKGAAAKRSAGGMKITITNDELKITSSGQSFARLAFLCLVLLSAQNIFAQDLTALSEQLRSGDTEQKRDALFQIKNLQTAAAARIAVPALNDAAEIVRATAAFAVIFLPPDEALAALAPLLQDKSELVRRETAYALGKIQNPQAVDLLLRTLQNDKMQAVKNAAVVALGEIGDLSALDALVQILRRKPTAEEEFFRRSAARAIGQIAWILQTGAAQKTTPESLLPAALKSVSEPKYKNLAQSFPPFRAAVPVLLQTLQNAREADDVRRETAFALGAVGDASALPALRSNLTGQDYYLAEICRESIKKILSVNPTE